MEVEEELRGGVAEVEADLLGGFGDGRVRDEIVGELVMQVGDAGGTFLGEGAGDAVGDFGGVRGGGESHDGHEDGWQQYGGADNGSGRGWGGQF